MGARGIAWLALAVWLVGGLLLTLRPGDPAAGQEIEDNFVPFTTIGIYLANTDSHFWVGQLVGNLLLMVPVGLLGPIALPWLDRWWRVLLLAALLSLAIEIAQLWIPDRSADVDDLLVNVAGAALGFLAFRLVRGLTRRPLRA